MDYNNWKSISIRHHNFNEQFFIIVGKIYSGIWVVKNQKIRKIGEWDNDRTIMDII